MNVQFNNLLTLLGKTLNKSNKPLTEPVDWGTVLSYARFHKVLPVILEEAQKYTDCLSHPSYNEYLSQATLSTVEQAQKTACFLQLYKSFSENGICPIVLKGIVCRSLYGELCDHRASGDEDILIASEDYENVHKILTSAGYVADFNNITRTQAQVFREILYTHPKLPLRIELHFNAIGHENDWLTKMNNWFNTDTLTYREITVDGINIKTLDHTEHFMYLICHALKHFTSCGLGIRQIVDILLYAKAYGKELDKSLIITKLKEIDAFDICSDFFHLGNEYLGFDFILDTQPLCLDLLIEDLSESGIYGNTTSARRISSQILTSAMSNRSSHQSKAKILMNTIFVDRRRLINNCPELEEKPHLAFKEHYKRFHKYIKLKKESKTNLTRDGIELSKKRMTLLKKYKLL